MVLDVDEERRRISLGLKQCQANPWKEFAENYNRGDKVGGQIKSITDFGIFIGLAGQHRRPGAPVATSPGTCPAKKRCATTRRASRSRPWCCRSIRSASASRSASSSWRRIRSRATSPTTRRAASSAASSRKWTRAARSSTSATASRASCAPPSSAATGSRMRASILKVGEEIEAKFVGVDRKTRTDHAVDQGQGNARGSRGRAELPLRAVAAPRAPAWATCSRSRSAAGSRLSRRRPVTGAGARRYRPSIGRGWARMTKSELIEIITAKQKHLPAKDVELALKQMLEIMSDALAAGRAHRDPRLRQLLAALPPAAPGAQSEDRRGGGARPASTCRISSPARICASGSTKARTSRSATDVRLGRAPRACLRRFRPNARDYRVASLQRTLQRPPIRRQPAVAHG